jgi:hypothetical protein
MPNHAPKAFEDRQFGSEVIVTGMRSEEGCSVSARPVTAIVTVQIVTARPCLVLKYNAAKHDREYAGLNLT